MNDAHDDNCDPVLRPFLAAETDEGAEECLNRIFLDPIIPQIRRVLAAYLTLTSFDRDEISAEAQARVLRRLQELRRSDNGKLHPKGKILDFKAYVATVVYNARKDLIHSRQPEWRRINHRIRRLADDPDSGICFTQLGNGQELVGLISSNAQATDVGIAIDRVRSAFPNHLFLPIQILVPALLENADGGLLCKDLVRAVFELTGAGSLEEIEISEDLNDLKTSSENDDAIARRQEAALRQIWEEIVRFPPNQRKTMILSLRENRSTEAVSLLLRKRIATIREIAESLEVTVDEFAVIFDQLPMSSAEIAKFLGIEGGPRTSKEQKVDNLRRIARDLLRRRLGFKK